MMLTKSQIKVLGVIYGATDCSNEVYDWATLHHTQAKIADAMPGLVKSIDNCVQVDGDGFIGDVERWGRGFRLTASGYEALTAHDPERWPKRLRRFAKAKGGGA